MRDLPETVQDREEHDQASLEENSDAQDQENRANFDQDTPNAGTQIHSPHQEHTQMEESGKTQVPESTSSRSNATNNHDAVNQNAREVNDQKSTPTPKQSDDTFYEVDKLLKVRRIAGQTQYLVKWKGDFPSSWEPEDYITERPKREFHAQRTKMGRRRRRRKSQFYRNQLLGQQHVLGVHLSNSGTVRQTSFFKDNNINHYQLELLSCQSSFLWD